jgi:hypothetical protein
MWHVDNDNDSIIVCLQTADRAFQITTHTAPLSRLFEHQPWLFEHQPLLILLLEVHTHCPLLASLHGGIAYNQSADAPDTASCLLGG